jgi:hypothetical protein
MPFTLKSRSNSDLDERMRAFVQYHGQALGVNNHDEAQVVFHKRGFISTMYRIHSADRGYLLAIKHYDQNARRAEREHQVLSARAGRSAPYPVLVDTSRTHFDDAVLVTELVPYGRAARWDPPSYDALAALMADIHEDARLMTLAVDEAGPTKYSLLTEFHEEIEAIPTFQPHPLRDLVLQMRDMLVEPVQRWAQRFPPDELVYLHGDLPHNHVFQAERGPLVIHWEYSRRSHPSRDFGRTSCLLRLSDNQTAVLLDRYRAITGRRVPLALVQIQELMEYFYSCIHGVFWMDRRGYAVAEKRVRDAISRAQLTQLVLRTDIPRVGTGGGTDR